MANENILALLKRIEMFLEDGDWKKADEYCERVLDIEPECAEAYLYKLMVELKVCRKEELKMCERPFYENEFCKKVFLFGDDSLKAELLGYIESNKDIVERNRLEHENKVKNRKKKLLKSAKIIVPVIALIIVVGVLLINVIIPGVKNSKQYNEAVELMNSGNYTKAKSIFLELNGYKESEVLSKECDYLYAIENMNNENYREAISIFEKMTDYKDSAGKTMELKLTCIKEAEIGDSVWFGNYEQDNNLENGKETVEWIVLYKGEGQIYVMSKKGLDYKAYNEERTEVTWENSSIRKWLNNEFYNETFSDAEKEMISEEEVANYESVNFETGEYDKVYDNIFLFSNFEVEYYVGFDDRRCEPTDYALSNKDWHNLIETDDELSNNCEWWTRSAEEDYWGFGYQYGYVEEDGNLAWRLGDCVRTNAVRPTMCINIE